MASYNDAVRNFEQRFNTQEGDITNWSLILNGDKWPIEAYRVFSTKELAIGIITPVEHPVTHAKIYHIYAGALISVVSDPIPGNNGVYQVIESIDSSTQEKTLELMKLCDENDSTFIELFKAPNDVSIGDTSYINYIEELSEDSSLIYLTGVDAEDASDGKITKLYYNRGLCYASGNMLTPSDINLKEVSSLLNVDPDKLSQIDKILFTWKDASDKIPQIGVSAQSVEKVYPELVYTNPATGYKMVNYQGLAVLALSAIDNLNERVKKLEDIVIK